MITITFIAGALPPNFCPIGWQNTFQGFVNALSGQINGLGYVQVNVSQTAPAISSDYLWLKVSYGGYPVQLYTAAGGTWVPVQPTFFFPDLTDVGSGNSYQVNGVVIPTTINPDNTPATGLVAGMTFLFKAIHTNTGASTFQVNAYTQNPLLVGATPLLANAVLANNWYVVMWDGTNFQLLNQNPQSVAVFKTLTSYTITTIPAVNAGTQVNLGAHNLGGLPTVLEAYWQCITPGDGNFIAGQRLPYAVVQGLFFSAGLSFVNGPAVWPLADATNVYMVYTKNLGGDALTNYSVAHVGEGSGSGYVYLTPARWNLVVIASL